MTGISPSICILDDDSSVLRSIVRLLDSEGLAANAFEHAEDLIAHVRSHPVLLAVLDVWMPEGSGLEVQARLREISPETQVIVMTGRDDPGIRATAMEGGALAFLSKPFDDETFLAAVHRALGRVD